MSPFPLNSKNPYYSKLTLYCSRPFIFSNIPKQLLTQCPFTLYPNPSILICIFLIISSERENNREETQKVARFKFVYLNKGQISFIQLLDYILQSSQVLAMNMEHADTILAGLKDKEEINSIDLQKDLGLNYEAMYAELVSLVADNYIAIESKKLTKFVLSKEGQKYADQGTPEAKIFQLATLEGRPKQQIEEILGPAFKIGFGNAKAKKIVDLKDGKIFKAKQDYEDEDKIILNKVRNGDIEAIKAEIPKLKKRKLVEEKQETHFIIRKGEAYREKKVQFKTEITSAMIAENSWKDFEFKSFNPNAKGTEIQTGNLHVLMKTRQQFKEILTEMGFEEMQTDRYVQSSFWNFDALFQPQAHPARDAHDTFFVSNPKESKIEDEQYKEEVKKIHEIGGFGSKGYDCDWDIKQAQKNLLRTHTTAVSSKTLKSIAAEVPFRPRKFFSIDRVFRNETLDNTHLAEFHQVEGFIIDKNLGLNHLIGILTEFYKKIGIEQITFKPTYNPYTEPSMEIFGVHPILKKKVQIGNSGIFRPEMLRPMGFPEDVSVIAWGLGLQRPTMIQFGLSNIKQLFGPAVSIRKVKDSPIYCL